MMYYKNYLEQSGIDLEQLEDNLEIIADHLFFLSRAPQGPSMTPVRPAKAKYRIVAQQKRACSFAGGKA